MSEYTPMFDRLVDHEVRSRISRRDPRPRGPRPPGRRHALARRLHALADRLDG